MLRATSEIAVAISVRSVLEKPSWDDRRRPSWRAVTMSASEEIGTWTSSAATAALHRDPVEEGQALLEIEGGVHPFQVQAELDHRESHLGLDAHHHRLAPRRFAMCAIPRSDRAANESITSSAVTSTMIPRERIDPARCSSSSLSPST